MIMKKIGLTSFFEGIIAPELSDHSSDKKRLIERAIGEYGLKKGECIMIGDTEYDIKGAVDAGVASIAVTYGYGDISSLKSAGATYIADSVKEISNYIKAGDGSRGSR